MVTSVSATLLHTIGGYAENVVVLDADCCRVSGMSNRKFGELWANFWRKMGKVTDCLCHQLKTCGINYFYLKTL